MYVYFINRKVAELDKGKGREANENENSASEDADESDGNGSDEGYLSFIAFVKEAGRPEAYYLLQR
jgi:hypothetical protein